jgi:hypothetical protein
MSRLGSTFYFEVILGYIMSLTKEQKRQISDFSDHPDFSRKGGLITDLDGTVIQQKDGRYFMPEPVQYGLTEIYQAGCQVIINTMRFPLSVIKTFAEDWYTISQGSVPLVSLNGSQTGYIHKDEKSGFTFEEIESFPLREKELARFIADLDGILSTDGSPLVFYYPRNWQKGEIIWTPDAGRVNEIKDRYRSASQVYGGDVRKLQDHLGAEDINMIFLLPGTDPSNAPQFTGFKDFYSGQHVNKLTGAKKMIHHLGRKIDHFIGAGDTPMDVFLKEVGLVLKVGTLNLDFDCKSEVLQIDRLEEIGEAFTELAMSFQGTKSL